jgi:hypothetical protein
VLVRWQWRLEPIWQLLCLWDPKNPLDQDVAASMRIWPVDPFVLLEKCHDRPHDGDGKATIGDRLQWVLPHIHPRCLSVATRVDREGCPHPARRHGRCICAPRQSHFFQFRFPGRNTQAPRGMATSGFSAHCRQFDGQVVWVPGRVPQAGEHLTSTR